MQPDPEPLIPNPEGKGNMFSEPMNPVLEFKIPDE